MPETTAAQMRPRVFLVNNHRAIIFRRHRGRYFSNCVRGKRLYPRLPITSLAEFTNNFA